MDAAVKRAAPSPRCYQRRRPERTLWYRTVQAHFETWLALSAGQGDASPPAHVEQAFRRYLECGILARGFARAYCDECKHEFLIAFSCKGRGVCPRIGAAAENRPGARAAAVGGRKSFGTSVQRSSMGYVGAACTGVRVRSAHRLVTRNFFLAMGALVRSVRLGRNFQCGTEIFCLFACG